MAIGPGEQPRRGLADMADAEGIDEPVEGDDATGIDGGEEVAGTGLAPTFAFLERWFQGPVALGQREDVGRRGEQTLVENSLNDLLANALDVEGAARHEVAQALDPLGRADEAAGAAPDRIELAGLLIELAHRMAATDRTDFGEDEGPGAFRPELRKDAQDLRDDVAGALDHHRVADADVLAGDLVLIVQRGIRHHHASDGDRLEPRHRGQRAGAPDLELDPSSTVLACSAGNLWAMAQRGLRDTKPSRAW